MLAFYDFRVAITERSDVGRPSEAPFHHPAYPRIVDIFSTRNDSNIGSVGSRMSIGMRLPINRHRFHRNRIWQSYLQWLIACLLRLSKRVLPPAHKLSTSHSSPSTSRAPRVARRFRKTSASTSSSTTKPTVMSSFAEHQSTQGASSSPKASSCNPSARSKGAKRPPLTHFLCIPLVNDLTRRQLDRSLRHFREDILTDGIGDPGLDSDESVEMIMQAIRPVGTLHLTLGVMSLMSEERVAEAVGVLKSLDLGTLSMESGSEGSDVADGKIGTPVGERKGTTERIPPAGLLKSTGSMPVAANTTENSFLRIRGRLN